MQRSGAEVNSSINESAELTQGGSLVISYSGSLSWLGSMYIQPVLSIYYLCLSVTSLLSVLVLCNLSTTSLLYACLSGIVYLSITITSLRLLPAEYLFFCVSTVSFLSNFFLSLLLSVRSLLYVSCLHNPIDFFFPFHLFF